MMQRKALVLQATEQALHVRRAAQVSLGDPINVFDLAANLGIEVRFVDVPSMEGMYVKQVPAVILVSALRPPGRQAFTCAHEVGHHIFDHGTRVDQLLDQVGMAKRFQPEEFLADCFAGILLMPRSAVAGAFARRGWTAATCTALQAYIVATWFGVGYTTLINHMVHTLHLMPNAHGTALLRIQPKRIRADVLGTSCSQDLIIVDEHWTQRAVDMHVGDMLYAPAGTVHEGPTVSVVQQDVQSTVFVGCAPGIGRLVQPATRWSTYVRVGRRGYVGRSVFRHLEDEDDDSVDD